MTFDEIKKILKTKTVGIAGAGGLGSNCAVALARSGIGKIIIADFDIITDSNLNRQHYYTDQAGQFKSYTISDNIYFINPETEVVPHNVKLDPEKIIEIFGNCDLIIEAFDNAEAKQMIIETVETQLPEIPLIVGLGMAGFGDNNSIKQRQVGNLYICGDEKSEIAEDNPPLAPRVGIVANMQANTALEILLSVS
jgi:sulfur carrier protein ThiS adenylyltransferase